MNNMYQCQCGGYKVQGTGAISVGPGMYPCQCGQAGQATQWQTISLAALTMKMSAIEQKLDRILKLLIAPATGDDE